MKSSIFDKITDIEELMLFYDSIINDGHIISLVNIKNSLKLSTDLSQKFLQHYFDQRKERLAATFLIEGYKPDGKEYVCAVVSENELQKLKDANNYTIKVYSLKSKLSRADASCLWKLELNDLNKSCAQVDFKKELFIPQFSDIVLHDIKLKNQNNVPHEKNESTPIKKREVEEMPIKVKKEVLIEGNGEENVLQPNRENKINERKIFQTQTHSKTTKVKTILDCTQIKCVKRKHDTTLEEERNLGENTKYIKESRTMKPTDAFYAGANTTINKNFNNYTDANRKESIEKVATENGETLAPDILFHSDSSSDEKEEEQKNMVKCEESQEQQKENKKTVVEVLGPVRKMQRIQSVKETQMHFENGYLVTTEKDSCAHLSETDNTPPKKEALMSTALVQPNKKRKYSQQTLLTNFFKKIT